MLTRDELVSRLDGYLEAPRFRDYCPNGLQVEGRREVSKVALGVTASLAFLEQAAAWGAHAVVVHHGLFWRAADELRIERSLKARLKVLFNRDMSLLAYHLPLDVHPEVGNNTVLLKKLGAEVVGPAFEEDGIALGLTARMPTPALAGELFKSIGRIVGKEPMILTGGPEVIRTLGVVSGRAPKFLEEAARRGLHVFVTGEPSEPAVHIAREEKIHLVVAGHHAMERLGVQALGDYIQHQFGLETQFIDDPNPV